MSRTQHEASLCALLVDDVYGELPCRIITVLLSRGRLPTHRLGELTGLSPGLLKKGLVVLIQQNLIYFYVDILKETTHYEANWDAAFALARTGRIIDVVEGRFGADAKDVVQNLLLLGHTKVGDLVEAYSQKKTVLERAAQRNNNSDTDVEMTTGDQTNGEANDAGETNGDHHKTGITHAQLDDILCQLLKCGYIQPVTAAHFKSPADTYDDIERLIIGQNGGEKVSKGTKKYQTIQGLIRDELKEIRDNKGKWSPLSKGNKRLRDDSYSTGPDKRRKLASGASVNGSKYGQQDDDIRLDPDMVVRVNHEKLAVALRNQHLVELAEKRIGITTSLVYSKLLELMEDRIPRCRPDPAIDDPDSYPEIPEIPLQDIANKLPIEIDLSQGIAKARRETGEGDSEDVADDDTPLSPASNQVSPDNRNSAPIVVDKRIRQEQTRQHLLLLAADRRQFALSSGRGGNTLWTVEFDKLGENLRDDELDSMVWVRFGDKGVRLMRILREKGKLDEKAISNIALLKITEVRAQLVDMQLAGFVDVQEVPKDATRTPMRSFFLWHCDGARVAKLMTDNVYKSMTRTLQRLDVERYRDKEAIETSERTDVDGDLDKLSGATVKTLTQFLKKEELLTGLMVKLEKTAAIFREY